MLINTTENYNEGRFGNQFIRNMAYHFIAKKNNLFITYENYELIKELGVSLFTNGNNYYSEHIIIDETNFFDYIDSNTPLLTTNIKLIPRTTYAHNDEIFYAQTSQFAKYLFNYFQQPEIKNQIIEHNIYKERFNNNNDLFIHVRLGDVPHLNPGFDYYDKILSNQQYKIFFTKGYISSDSIDHDICKRLINKYNLEIFNQSELNTIMLANTCKYIILSNGSFSWLMGLFGSFFDSQIYYPIPEIHWHGPIYEASKSWIGIKLSNKYNYVINLDRRPDRYSDFLEKIEKTDLFKNENFIRFSAFDGANFKNELKRFDYENHPLINNLKNISKTDKIKTGELGAFISHLEVLKAISINNNINEDDYVKVFEDDIFFNNDFIQNYNKLNVIFKEENKNRNFIYLGGRFTDSFDININNNDFYQKPPGNDFIYKRKPIQNPGFNMQWDRINCSYMIKKSFSQQFYNIILKITEEKFMPIDTLYLMLHTHLDFYEFYPHLFWSPLNYKSDIQTQEPQYIDFSEIETESQNNQSNKINISLIGFWHSFDINTDPFIKKLLNSKYNIQFNNNTIYQSNKIIVGSFINEELYNIILDIYNNHKNIDLLLYVTEPIGNYYIPTFKLLQLNVFKKIFGSIISEENRITSFKYPIYLNKFDNLNTIQDLFNNTNKYVKQSSSCLSNKKFGCLINRHDDGNTRTNIYKLLNTINNIECPGLLFNNCCNKNINEIGNVTYIKNFIFNICPENFKTQFNGYITEKLLNACLGGAIPVFFGHFDMVDERIFNKNRIIFFDPENSSSLIDTFILIKNLFENKENLENFYKRDVFAETAYETVMNMENNLASFLFS